VLLPRPRLKLGSVLSSGFHHGWHYSHCNCCGQGCHLLQKKTGMNTLSLWWNQVCRVVCCGEAVSSPHALRWSMGEGKYRQFQSVSLIDGHFGIAFEKCQLMPGARPCSRTLNRYESVSITRLAKVLAHYPEGPIFRRLELGLRLVGLGLWLVGLQFVLCRFSPGLVGLWLLWLRYDTIRLTILMCAQKLTSSH